MGGEGRALTVRLPAPMLDRVRSMAASRGGLTVAAYIRLAVVERLERDEAARRQREG